MSIRQFLFRIKRGLLGAAHGPDIACTDSLTGLPDRRAFFARLNEAVRSATTENDRIAVGIVDLDGFRPINDLHGHATGDRLLGAIATRLSDLQDDKVHLSRLGGDEFALIIRDYTDEDDLLAFGDKVCALLHLPVRIGETVVRIGGSLGFATWPRMAATATELFERADYALCNGKRDRRGQAVLFNADHEAAIHRDARIQQALNLADLERELSVAFQPIVDMTTRRPVAFEALTRWDGPMLGPVSPAQFIPVAERTGIIGMVTRCLLQKALAEALRWPPDVRLSFNLSAHDLSSAEGVLRLIALIEASGFDPRRLDLEITETAVLQDVEEASLAIARLRMLGCGISLDDFGTGYASLSQLHALPLTKIKIDRSFVVDIDRKPASYKIVRSLLNLCRDLGLECIVEGVETEAEMDTLRQLGCVMAQGFYFTPALSVAELDTYLSGYPTALSA